MPDYKVKLQDFEGPLELLLTLINNNKLDISEISLSKVTDEYLSYIDDNENLDINEIADFLLIAAKLLYIKSKIILPNAINIIYEEETELENQLKIYKEYYEARKRLQKIINQKNFKYSRTTPLIKIKAKFRAPKNLKTIDLKNKFETIISSLRPIIELPNRKTIDKTISIKEKIDHIKSLINTKNLSFLDFIQNKKNKTEIIISFLAILELIKQRTITANQDYIFAKITIKNNKNGHC